VERGEELAREGDFDEAISAYTEAIDLNPENGEAYNLRGVAYSRSGDDEQAIDDYTQAINHNHDPLALVYANRAVSYLRQDNYEQGIADATQAIELEPYDAGYYNLRGNIYFNAGDYAQALNDYTEAIDLAPDYDWAYSNRAGTHFRLQDIDAALRDARKAVELNPDEAEFQAILCLYGSLGKSVEMEACERAVELAPDNGAFRGRRGIARALTSDLAGAAEDFTFHKEWLETNFPNNTILIAEREAWIAALKSGENPIDEETLEALREFYK
jgi:tetratricopeptide (TPR) repeat protein